MSRINYHRKDSWKIKIRKPVSIRPSKIMDETKYERRHTKLKLRELLKEAISETNSK